MAEASDDSSAVEKLYEYGERLNDAKDKSQLASEYGEIIKKAEQGHSCKVKQLAAQLIPKYSKYFPALAEEAISVHSDLLVDEELGAIDAWLNKLSLYSDQCLSTSLVRVQAIRGLPLFCKDNPEHLSKIVDLCRQLLAAVGENVERDALHKSLMALLRQDIKTSLTFLFKYIGNADDRSADGRSADERSADEATREKVLCFIRDKVFPLKAELFKPQEEIERHIANLVKESLQDVTGAEFKMFMDFLRSLALFGPDAPVQRAQELVGIIEGKADLDAQFNISDGDHFDRFISCLHLGLPLFMSGASSGKFLNYSNAQILPVFDKLPEERKIDLLKNLAECSPYVTSKDSREALPSVVQILKKQMVRRKVEEMNFTYIECLLYIFHHLAHRTPNATNSLCGYKIVTGQPSDRLGEDFSEQFKDFSERLRTIDDLAKAMVKKLTQGTNERNKLMAAAKTDEEKDVVKKQKQNSAIGLRTCNNILAMIQPLYSKSPSFIGDKRISLSWQEPAKPESSAPTSKRPAAAVANGSGNNSFKRGRGAPVVQNQLVNRALEGLHNGGSRHTWRGRGWGGGRGRGRGYY